MNGALTGISGTLVIEADGDYASMTGAALIKKLILRRLTTKPGDFFHLPEYGIGLREKEPLPVADLRKLAKAIELQVAQEPEVGAVKATLAYSASAETLNVRVQAQLKATGQQVDVAVAVPTGQVVL
jgi:hypothetical protein